MVESTEAADVPALTPSGAQSAEASADASLLERDRELAVCEAALDAAIAGRGGMVVVEGPAGIGKTELLRAVRAHAVAGGMRPLTARGLEVERDLAFGGVRQLLDPVLQAAAPEDTARLFAGAARPAGRVFDHGRGKARSQADPTFATLNALYWVLAGLADAQPLLLMIDDAHWLDPPTLRLLEFLAPRIDELASAAVVATRPVEEAHEDAILGRLLTDPGARVIRPAPLSAAAVAQLVRARLDHEPDPAFVEACADVTGGNPFYLSELLRELELRGVSGNRDDAARVRDVAPRAVSLALRFRGAAAAERMALTRAVAVLGDGARLEDAAALAGLDEETAAGTADALVREAILAPAPALAFTHPIVRTAVYAEIGPSERGRAHARAARQLQSVGAPLERVAAHLMQTDPAGDPRVVEMLRAAAAAVLAQGAPETAAHYLRRALAEPPGEAARADVLLQLGRAEASTAHPEAPAHLAEAYAAATDPGTRADAAFAGALGLFAAGHAGEAAAMLAAAAEELADDESDRALELEAELLSLAMHEPTLASHHLRRLDRVDEDLRGDSPGARMMLCLLAYRRMWRSQDAARATALTERALAGGRLLAERGPEALQLSMTALTLIGADRLETAAELLDAALIQARELGSRYGFWVVSLLRSELAYRHGALHQVEADARAALDITLPSGHLMGAAAATGTLIDALLERGALGEAGKALSAVGLVEGTLPPQPLPYNLLLSVRGRLRVARGDVVGGLEDLHECGRRNAQIEARNPIFIPWRSDAALAHHARGEIDTARVLAEDELAAARDWGTPGAMGAAKRLAALLRSGEEAIALLGEATALLADSPARLEYARALVELGAALRRANRRTEAREQLMRGLDLADRCGAKLLSQRARDELRATGARPRRTRLSGLEALTASERRVAEMAARGLGNTNIAQTLFVTRKTVEKHLSNAYTKLGVNSRSELSALFREEARPGDEPAATEPTLGRA